MTNHLFSLVRDGVPDPAKTVIEAHDGRLYSYADLIARSGAYAAALVAAGVAPGDRVAVQADKSAEFIFLYLGVVRAGAVFLPLNTAYTPAEVGYFLGDAEPTLFVCDPGKREALAGAAAGVRHVWTLDGAGAGTAAEAADAQDGATFTDVPRARRISPRSSTPRARPGAPRAPCSATTTSPRTRR